MKWTSPYGGVAELNPDVDVNAPPSTVRDAPSGISTYPTVRDWPDERTGLDPKPASGNEKNCNWTAQRLKANVPPGWTDNDSAVSEPPFIISDALGATSIPAA